MITFCSDLSFKKGDIIYLRKRVDNHWYQGECDGKHGVFPLSYVQVTIITLIKKINFYLSSRYKIELI